MVQPGHQSICVGRISKTHGYKGAVRIDLDGGIDLKIPKKQEPVFLEIHQKPVPFFYTRWDDGDTSQFVQFEDITTEEQAKELVGLQVYVPKKWVQENDEVSAAALIGFTVQDEVLGTLGTITDFMEQPAQTLLYMVYQGKEILLPLVDEFFKEIDFDRQVIHTALPEGLMDL